MNILITGGTGSFGQAFVKKLLAQQVAKRIVIYSRGEHAQEHMARALDAWGADHPVLRFFIGDIRDLDRLCLAMHGIDTVVHAAALKIVPTAEYNPTECVATNIGGAENVVKAALHCGVKRVLALSTDKAVNPVNLYGATKLCAEKIFIAANSLAAGRCRFSVMRYGNVAGSAGSVLPLFQRLASEGKPLPITDERMTRFWITLDDATTFAIACLEMMTGREIFVPKIPSIRIVDLAAAISDKITPNTGIRPGEKLHETLISEDEARMTFDFHDWFIIGPTKWQGGMPVAGGAYTSLNNKEWLSVEELKEMVK